MFEKFTSERLVRELSRSMLNFLWYLWDAYHDPSKSEFRISLQADNASEQGFTIPSAGITTTQNFDCRLNAEIVIRRAGARCFMEYG